MDLKESDGVYIVGGPTLGGGGLYAGGGGGLQVVETNVQHAEDLRGWFQNVLVGVGSMAVESRSAGKCGVS